jgi:AcrR family transcriptional regulator
MGKREQNRIEQRARILDSARSLFAAEGFEQVTVSDIARSAGVARATVFNYFPSKHALVDAITEDVLGYYGRMLERALADDETPTSTLLRALFDHMGDGIEHLQQYYRGVFREIAKMQIGLDEGGSTAAERHLCAGRLAAIMRRGQERGELTREHTAEDLAHASDSLSHGTIVQWLYDDASKSLRDRMGRAMEIFLGGAAIGALPRRDEPLPDLGDPGFGEDG